MKHLVPCPECNRHVRVSEKECPFCALPLDLAGTPEPQLPRGRLSRAATLAFGATLVSATTLAACGGDAEDSGVPNNAGSAGLASAGANLGGAGTISGAPAGGQFGVAGSASGGAGGSPVPLYGAAGRPSEDTGMGGTMNLAGAAGEGAEAGEGGDADHTGGDGGGPVAVYGGPP